MERALHLKVTKRGCISTHCGVRKPRNAVSIAPESDQKCGLARDCALKVAGK